MRTKRGIAAFMVALLSVAAVYAKDIRVAVFKVDQMHCEKCEKKVKDNMRFEKGLKEIVTVLKEHQVTITYDAEKTSVEKLKEGFRKFKYEAELLKDDKKSGDKK